MSKKGDGKVSMNNEFIDTKAETDMQLKEATCTKLIDAKAEANVELKDATSTMSAKDRNYLPWNDYFMSLSYLIAAGSRHPVTKVGACIINEDNKVISVGYNGMPNGIDEAMLSWEETESSSATKNPYVVHAEMNAIMNGKHIDFMNCKMFVTEFPCSECAKLIIQAGIKEVFYAEKRKSLTKEIMIPTMKMFDLAGVSLKYFQPSIKKLKIDLHNVSTYLIRTDEDCNI
ncbi:deoxycytidylate deaminase-like [Uloborus diversus]|uniref:deoxycytidylate deaminase-like n=1 Tax=Uloborus diversus TaxID=327109 RepID=UPI002409095A|nr:deoxycytidylate deaminase-like [Uloborus diversus]XP_054721809.1 deoxycytidylate deaminase-like [Uloborus diversus]XP_054721810.1 deoxycytidylate deaminase-like [Uloborus diversus]